VGLRRLKAGFFTAVVMAVLAADPTVAASAETHPTQVAARIRNVRDALNRLGSALNDAERELSQAEFAASRHQKALQTASQRQQLLTTAFSGRAAALYSMGSGSLIETILGSQDLDDFVDRFQYLEEIRSREQRLLEELTALRRRARIETAEMTRSIKLASSARKDLVARRGELLAKLRELQSLQNLLDALGGRGGGRASRLSRAPNGFVCPVAGSHYLTNNYGDPRPGGPHTGEDIQADYGVPTVAVLPSRVVSTPSGGWIGIGVIIRDAIGNEWWYVHMQTRYVSVGDKLKAGELLGRVGCTGRCYGPHLHFEYHPHGGGPANPHRILAGAC
jgi:murein DD-endopeptidase MepM/ murein hydrolase activator NlpD